MKQEKTYIYGKHAIEEALKNTPKAVEKVFFIDKEDRELKSLAFKKGIRIEVLNSRATLPAGMDIEGVHQGVIALIVLDKLMVPYKQFIKDLKITPDTAIVLMGELHDPQNVGAIIRSSAALGVSAVLVPEYNQVQMTGAVIKVSAGMAFRIPIVSVGNVNNTIRDLKDKGFWIYGLDGGGDTSINDEKFETPTVFVLGNESKGIRQKTYELCDIVLSIPMHSRCESMNVASSTAIALYAWSTKHSKALGV